VVWVSPIAAITDSQQQTTLQNIARHPIRALILTRLLIWFSGLATPSGQRTTSLAPNAAGVCIDETTPINANHKALRKASGTVRIDSSQAISGLVKIRQIGA
jgi:hypothetical protein